MAIRQPKAVERESDNTYNGKEETSASSDEVLDQEAEFHTDLEDEAMTAEEFHTDPEDASDEEFHTDPEDASDGEPAHVNDAALLPPELLKSKPADAPALHAKSWDQLTQKEKKELRDERGISMRELREEALGTGIVEAGKVAQIRRGIRPADKVAGGRIAKKRRTKGRTDIMPALSGKQKMLHQRQKPRREHRQSRPVRKQNG